MTDNSRNIYQDCTTDNNRPTPQDNIHQDRQQSSYTSRQHSSGQTTDNSRPTPPDNIHQDRQQSLAVGWGTKENGPFCPSESQAWFLFVCLFINPLFCVCVIQRFGWSIFVLFSGLDGQYLCYSVVCVISVCVILYLISVCVVP